MLDSFPCFHVAWTIGRTESRRLLVVVLLGTVSALSSSCSKQAPTPAPQLHSPEVHPNATVSFRFYAPNAAVVEVAIEGKQEHLPMQKDEQGVWSVTSLPMDPDYYGYSIEADGANLIDPSNPLLKPNLLATTSVLHVPGPASLPWELNDVPHGLIHHHFYRSDIVGDQRDYYVYTPPGYSANESKAYPVLYLSHGFSDDASGWTAVGRANVILDNLIAQGKAKPMLVVMTLGYGAPEILREGFGAFRNRDLVQRNITKYSETLLTEVIPQVERNYRVASDRNSRAIAGLSMGGAESLFVGLNNQNNFAWIGAFSSGGLPEDYNATFASLDAQSSSRILLWIACGTEDGLIAPNRKFRAWLKSKGIEHTAVETPGAHTWMVWRRNLAAFVPLLFKDNKPAPKF